MRRKLQPATTATTLLSGAVSRDRRHVFDPANLEARTGEGTKCGLPSRARALRSVPTSGLQPETLQFGQAWGTTERAVAYPKLDVDSGDPNRLAPLGHVLCGKHSSIRRGFVTVSFHLHPTSDTNNGFPKARCVSIRKTKLKRMEIVSKSNGCTHFPEISVTWTNVSLNDA